MMEGLGLKYQVDSLMTTLDGQKQELLSHGDLRGGQSQRAFDARERLLLIHGRVHKPVYDFALRLRDSAPRHYDRGTWETLADLTVQCGALNADCFAFDQTLRFRGRPNCPPPASLFNFAEISDAADNMIEEFSRKTGTPRTSYVLIAGAARFLPEISAIHLGYSHLSVWNLNRVAHEFGHKWAEECAGGPEGTQTRFLRIANSPWSESIARELFADILATYLLGPAYVCSGLLLDFNPTLRTSSSTHPSHDERAHAMLIVLRALEGDQGAFGPQIRGRIHALRQYWSEARQAAGASGLPLTLDTLEAEVPIVLQDLKRSIPRAQFLDMQSVFCAKMALKSSWQLHGTADIAGVFNGAWFARLDGDRALDVLESATLHALSGAEGSP